VKPSLAAKILEIPVIRLFQGMDPNKVVNSNNIFFYPTKQLINVQGKQIQISNFEELEILSKSGRFYGDG
jgi:hypothetical protein